MSAAYPITYDEIGRSYAVLRQGGAPPARAQAELALGPLAARQIEARFRRARSRAGHEAGRPAFARDATHLAAVAAAGGFPEVGR
jgi:hypothetical protein